MINTEEISRTKYVSQDDSSASGCSRSGDRTPSCCIGTSIGMTCATTTTSNGPEDQYFWNARLAEGSSSAEMIGMVEMGERQETESSLEVKEWLLPRVELEFNPDDLIKHRKMVLGVGPEEAEVSLRKTASKSDDEDQPKGVLTIEERL